MKSKKNPERFTRELSSLERSAYQQGTLLSWDDTLCQFRKMGSNGQSIELRLLENGELQTAPPIEDTAEDFVLIRGTNLYTRLAGAVRSSATEFGSVHVVLQRKRFLLSAHNGFYHFSSRKRPLSRLARFAVAYRSKGRVHIIIADDRVQPYVLSADLVDDPCIWHIACLAIVGLLRWDAPDKAKLLSVWLADSSEGCDLND